VGLAGLKAGVINQNTSFFCPGFFHLGSHRFNCWKVGGHGRVHLRNAIAQSCDTFFYHVAYQMGIEPMAKMATELGLGQKLNIGLLGEKTGIMPTPEWKRKSYNAPWVPGDTINSSIGQGYVLTNPLQLAVMTSRLVNGGYKVMPSLTPVEREPSDWPRMDVDDAHLALIVEGMNAVTNAYYGTAYGKRIDRPGFELGGKTGTSQVRRITKQGVDQNTLPWRFRHHALFVGYAPTSNPRFVCCVMIEHGGGGSSAAAPVARDVMLKVQELDEKNPRRYR